MPLPQSETKRLVVSDLQGINIERGVLVRPANSFQRLDNFDLIVAGAIRKIKGVRLLTPVSPASTAVVAMRDYRANPTAPELLLVLDKQGGLYSSTITADPITLFLQGQLLNPPVDLEEAPFIVAMPMFDEDTGEYTQYAYITLGTLSFPKKFGVSGISRIGVSNPGDSWDPTVPNQHALAAPQLQYTDDSLGIIFQYTSPNANQGVPITQGRRYRYSWYNPLTKHDSSLSLIHTGSNPIEYDTQPDMSKTKPLGVVTTTPNAPYLMAQPLFLDGLPQRNPTIAGAIPAALDEDGLYTHIRIWATRDGRSEYYLVPVIRDKDGTVISDSAGAVPLSGLYYGFMLPVDVAVAGFLAQTPLYDGYVPLTDTLAPGSVDWFDPILYDEIPRYTVAVGNVGDSQLSVLRDSVTLPVARVVERGAFVLPDDSTVYAITSVFNAGLGAYVWQITPPLAATVVVSAVVTFVFILPTLDADLITPFADTPGINSDREHDPPPKSSWGCVYQNRLFLLDAMDKTRLTYSRIGQYEDFPPDNFFRFIQSDYDEITAILTGRQVGDVSEGADQRLVIGKERSTGQITGTSGADFTQKALFSETGIVHKRAATVLGGYALGLSRQGLELFEAQRPLFLGAIIKDITDTIAYTDDFGPSFAQDRRDNQILMGLELSTVPSSGGDVELNSVLLMREPRANDGGGLASPFSKITSLPTLFGCLYESGFGAETRVLLGDDGGNIYQVFSTGEVEGTGETTPVNAVAETQALPQDDKETRKIFRSIRFEGDRVPEDDYDEINDLGWKIQFSTDFGDTWTPVRRMYSETLIGCVGKQLVTRIIHDRPVDESTEEQPMISNYSLMFTVIGSAR